MTFEYDLENKKISFWKRIKIFFYSKPIIYILGIVTPLVVQVILIWFSDYLTQPKFEGRVINLISGIDEGRPDHPLLYTTLLFITNRRDTPVPIINYKLYIEYKDGSHDEAIPMYDFNKDQIKDLTVSIPEINRKFNFRGDSEQNLLNKVSETVIPSKPLSGFVIFRSTSLKKMPSGKSNIKKIIVRLYDGYGESNDIETKEEELFPVEVSRFFIKSLEISPIKTYIIESPH